MPSVEQPASLPDPPSQAEGPCEAGGRDASPCPAIRGADTILQKVRYDGDEWFGLDYNMNLYRGCAHGCIYCDSRSECYRIDGFDQVRAKFDALSITATRAAQQTRARHRGRGRHVGHVQPLRVHAAGDARGARTHRGVRLRGVGRHEKHTCHARHRLAADQSARPAGPSRRSPSPRPTTTWPALSNRTRPCRVSASPALAELAEAGVFCGVLFTPTLPWVTDDDATVRAVVEGAAAAGAHFVYHTTGVTLRDRQRDHFLEAHRRRRPCAARPLSRNVRRALLLQLPARCPEPHPLPHPLQGTRPPLAHGRHHRRLQTRPPPGNASEPVLIGGVPQEAHHRPLGNASNFAQRTKRRHNAVRTMPTCEDAFVFPSLWLPDTVFPSLQFTDETACLAQRPRCFCLRFCCLRAKRRSDSSCFAWRDAALRSSLRASYPALMACCALVPMPAPSTCLRASRWRRLGFAWASASELPTCRCLGSLVVGVIATGALPTAHRRTPGFRCRWARWRRTRRDKPRSVRFRRARRCRPKIGRRAARSAWMTR